MSSSWASVAVGLYNAGFFVLLHRYAVVRSNCRPPQTLIWGGSLILVFLWHHELISRTLMDQPGDSFYSLSAFQQTGLVTWSILLIFVLFWLSIFKSNKVYAWRVAHNLWQLPAFIIDLSLTLILFFLLVRISPQIYYFYYQLVIPGLPAQWVIKPGVELDLLVPELLLHSRMGYSDLLTGLTFWSLNLGTLWRYLWLLTIRQWRMWSILIGAGFGLVYFCWATSYPLL